MSLPLITVTLNPAIDQTITLPALHPGAVNRATAATANAGGKGVNVASCLADWGMPPSVTGLLGAGNAELFEALFAAKGITDRFHRHPGLTRTNIKLSHGGDTTDINLPGPIATEAEAAAILGTLRGLATPQTLIILAGSLPAGLPDALYARMIAALAPTGATILLDTSGPALSQALHGQTLPFCIKPNRAELEAYAGAALPDDAAIIRAARALIARGVSLAAISLGAQGALYVTATQAARACLPAMATASTVGAGDAMVAGLAAAIAAREPFERIIRLSTAFACAKLTMPGPNLPSRARVLALADAVTITTIKTPPMGATPS